MSDEVSEYAQMLVTSFAEKGGLSMTRHAYHGGKHYLITVREVAGGQEYICADQQASLNTVSKQERKD